MTISFKDIVKIKEEIKEVQSIDFDNLQTFRSVYRSWNLGDTKEIGGSVNTLIIKKENHMRFLTRIPPGVVFPLHWHNFLEECVVLKGQLDSLRNDGEIWKLGDVASFPAFTKHHLENKLEEDCYLQVDYWRNR